MLTDQFTGSHPPTLIADVMLGRLARWLRLLGYDVEYRRDAEDCWLAQHVADTGRTLLTRDTLLAKRRLVRGRCILLTRNDSFEQLEEALPHLGPPPGRYSRCLECNTRLEAVTGDYVRLRVPPYVYRTQNQFARCPSCDRIYWPGTHREKAEALLRSSRIVPE